MKIINISGKARHGKDTTAAIFKDKLEQRGEKVIITHYADLLKYIARQFFGWDGIKDEKGVQLLQYLGTDVIRRKNPDYLVKFLIDMLEMFDNNWDYVLIPDCRFPNECDAWKERNWEIINMRIVRENFTSSLTKEQQKHRSEIALDDYKFDYYIYNNSGLRELENEVEEFINKYVE